MSNAKDYHERVERIVAAARAQFNSIRAELPQGHPQLANIEAALIRSEQTARGIRARLHSNRAHPTRPPGSRDGSATAPLSQVNTHPSKMTTPAHHALSHAADHQAEAPSASRKARRALNVLASSSRLKRPRLAQPGDARGEVTESLQNDSAERRETQERSVSAGEKLPPTRFVSAECVRTAVAACRLPPNVSVSVATEREDDSDPCFSVAIHVQCSNTWRAGLWIRQQKFSAVRGTKDSVLVGNERVLMPQSAKFVAVNETLCEFSTSKYAVFQALSERAIAAANCFWKRESSHSSSLSTFINWLALHRTVFSKASTVDGRILAFDTSRGIFVPAIIYSYALLPSLTRAKSTKNSTSSADGDTRGMLEYAPWPIHPRSCIPTKEDRHMPTGHHAIPTAAGAETKGIELPSANSSLVVADDKGKVST